MGRLNDQIALVTGASRGIGRAIALELAREGADVALNYHANEALAAEVAREAAQHGGRVMLARADIGNSQEARGLIQRVVDEWGRLDILVNNAGINRDHTLRKLTDEEWLEVINTDLNSVFFCTSAAVPVMIKQNRGRIINISSMIGQGGNIGQSNYGAAKGGIIGFTKSAALELARNNITVNAVCPGFTHTDMMVKVPENIQEQLRAKIPLGRFAEPEEVARAVVFLAADGDYITGQQLNINGGMYV